MTRNRLAPFDSLDSRREFVHLLDTLSPRERCRFASFVVKHLPGIAGKGVVFTPEQGLIEAAERDRRGRRSNTANTRLSNTIYLDLLVACTQWEADAEVMTEFLEAVVRRGINHMRELLAEIVSRRDASRVAGGS